MIAPQKAIHYQRYEFKKWKPFDAETIVESPVSLTVNGLAWLTSMCTPVNLEAMAVGFLFNEGVFKSMDEVEDVRICEPQRGTASILATDLRLHRRCYGGGRAGTRGCLV